MLDQEVIRKIEESTGHSVFGPSSLPRIVLCPGSVNECLKVPIKPSSKWAQHGTMLHEIVEKRLKGQPNGYDDLDIVDASYVMDCLNYAESIEKLHTSKTYIGIETQTSLASFGIPEVTGTADLTISSQERVDVIDWKFGSGVPRYATGCMQALAYGAGVCGFDSEHPDIPIYLHIVQPPLNIFDTWELTYKEMCKEVEKIRAAVQLAKAENPVRVAGLKQCRFCDANMVCSERHNATKRDAAKVFNAMSAPTIVSDNAIAMLLEKATAIQQYIKDAQKYATERIKQGHGFPGFKLVAGRSKRVWKDEEKAKDWMEDSGFDVEQLYPAKFITAPAAEKLHKSLKKNPAFQDLWEKKEGKPILVPEDDKRPALPTNTSVFDEYAE